MTTLDPSFDTFAEKQMDSTPDAPRTRLEALRVRRRAWLDFTCEEMTASEERRAFAEIEQLDLEIAALEAAEGHR